MADWVCGVGRRDHNIVHEHSAYISRGMHEFTTSECFLRHNSLYSAPFPFLKCRTKSLTNEMWSRGPTILLWLYVLKRLLIGQCLQSSDHANQHTSLSPPMCGQFGHVVLKWTFDVLMRVRRDGRMSRATSPVLGDRGIRKSRRVKLMT